VNSGSWTEIQVSLTLRSKVLTKIAITFCINVEPQELKDLGFYLKSLLPYIAEYEETRNNDLRNWESKNVICYTKT
jgi:hypothetical protein